MEDKECSNLKAYYFRTKNSLALYLDFVLIPEDKIDMNTPIIEWSPERFSFYAIRELFFKYKDFASHLRTSICKENVNKMHIYMNPTIKTFPEDKTLEESIRSTRIHICKLFKDADEIGPGIHPDYENHLAIMCNLQRSRDIIMERFDNIIRAQLMPTNKQRIKVIYHFSNTGRRTIRPKSFKYTIISHYVRRDDKKYETT